MSRTDRIFLFSASTVFFLLFTCVFAAEGMKDIPDEAQARLYADICPPVSIIHEDESDSYWQINVDLIQTSDTLIAQRAHLTHCCDVVRVQDSAHSATITTTRIERDIWY